MPLRKLPACGFLSVIALASCHRAAPPLPPAHPHYVIGGGWQGGGNWFYPAESFSLRQTGLAILEANQTPHVTADGEVWSANSMTGAHQTLQLPAIVSVRNLANGRTVRIRLNERGPDNAGRILAVTPQVAAVLGIGHDPAPIELTVDEEASRAIAQASPDAPRLDVSAAPRGDVVAQSLDGGIAQTVGEHQTGVVSTPGGLRLSELPVRYTQGYAMPVAYNVTLGDFSGHGAADGVARRCGGDVRRISGNDPGLNWQARLGPYQTIAQADQALAQARSCGIAGARIVVE